MRRVSAREKADAVAAYLDGVPVPDIAARYSVSTRSVPRWVAAAGRPLRGHSPIADGVQSAAVAAYAAGDPAAVVAEAFGVSAATVIGWARAAGVPVRSRGDYFAVPGEVRAAAVAAYGSGRTAADVAAEFGVCQSTVVSWARRAGVSRAGERRPRSSAEVAAVVAEYVAGESSTVVGARHRVAPVRVLRWVRAAGQSVRPPGTGSRVPAGTRAAVVRAYADGATAGAVAVRFGVTAEAVYRWAAAAGVRKRRR